MPGIPARLRVGDPYALPLLPDITGGGVRPGRPTPMGAGHPSHPTRRETVADRAGGREGRAFPPTPKQNTRQPNPDSERNETKRTHTSVDRSPSLTQQRERRNEKRPAFPTPQGGREGEGGGRVQLEATASNEPGHPCLTDQPSERSHHATSRQG